MNNGSEWNQIKKEVVEKIDQLQHIQNKIGHRTQAAQALNREYITPRLQMLKQFCCSIPDKK